MFNLSNTFQLKRYPFACVVHFLHSHVDVKMTPKFLAFLTSMIFADQTLKGMQAYKGGSSHSRLDSSLSDISISC